MFDCIKKYNLISPELLFKKFYIDIRTEISYTKQETDDLLANEIYTIVQWCNHKWTLVAEAYQYDK
jgi:hypothetical protein